MKQVVLVNCALAAQRGGGCGAVGLRPRHSRCRPSGAKQPWLFGESSLLHSGCDTCILLPISADSSVLSPGRGDILNAVGASPCATTHLRQVKKFWGVLFQAQIYSKRGLSLVHVAFRTKAFEYLD